MARRQPDIKVRLERQEKKILKLSEELEVAKDEYEKLLQEQKSMLRGLLHHFHQQKSAPPRFQDSHLPGGETQPSDPYYLPR